MLPSKCPQKYGTSEPESEVVLGATLQDLDYVDLALDFMTISEIERFKVTIETLYGQVQRKMAAKGLFVHLTNLRIQSQLDSIISATAS